MLIAVTAKKDCEANSHNDLLGSYGHFRLQKIYSCRIPRSLLRGFQAFAKSVPEGAKFRNTPSACGGDRNFEDFASLFHLGGS